VLLLGGLDAALQISWVAWVMAPSMVRTRATGPAASAWRGCRRNRARKRELVKSGYSS